MIYVYLHKLTQKLHFFPEEINDNTRAIAANLKLVADPMHILPSTLFNINNIVYHTNFEFNQQGDQLGPALPEYEDLGSWSSTYYTGTGYITSRPQKVIDPSVEAPERDFPQRYMETWVRAKHPFSPDPDIIYFHTSGGAGSSFQVVYSSANFSKQFTSLLSDIQILETLPKNKYVNAEAGYPVLFLRTADRQWKRGVCNSTYQLYIPTHEDADSIKHSLHNTNLTFMSREGSKRVDPFLGIHKRSGNFWGAKTMKELFDPEYPSYTKAWEMINKGQKYAVAFSPMMYLSASPKTDQLILGMGKIEIGTLPMDNPNKILVTKPMMYQEVVDMVKRQSLGYVEVRKA